MKMLWLQDLSLSSFFFKENIIVFIFFYYFQISILFLNAFFLVLNLFFKKLFSF